MIGQFFAALWVLRGMYSRRHDNSPLFHFGHLPHINGLDWPEILTVSFQHLISQHQKISSLIKHSRLIGDTGTVAIRGKCAPS